MSWVEVDGAEWSSVELGAGFSNTHLNISYSYYHLQCLKNNLQLKGFVNYRKKLHVNREK